MAEITLNVAARVRNAMAEIYANIQSTICRRSVYIHHILDPIPVISPLIHMWLIHLQHII